MSAVVRIKRCHQRIQNGFEHADRKSTRLNSSHLVISYAVFCLKKKKNDNDGLGVNGIFIAVARAKILLTHDSLPPAGLTCELLNIDYRVPGNTVAWLIRYEFDC